VNLVLTKKVRPVNSLLFISDQDGGEPPTPVRGARLLSTSSCVSIGCYPEQDGPTELVLGDMADVDPAFDPVFDGELSTPSGTIMVSTATLERLLEARVSKTKTRVRIWINDPQWPDKVIVGVG
jgi:hypothetical protein